MEAETKLSTPYLSHFTEHFTSVLGIIKTGFKPSRLRELLIVNEKTDYHTNLLQCMPSMFIPKDDDGREIQKNDNDSHKHILMTSFCDIPHKLSDAHQAIYGNYCIALTKEWGIANGCSPVLYLAKNSKLHNALFSLNKDNAVVASSQFNTLKGLIKPYIDEFNGYKYYDEREWRYLPSEDEQFDLNNGHVLLFEAKDIVFIVVQTKREKKILKSALAEKFGDGVSVKIKVK